MHLATAQTLEHQGKPEAAQYVQSAAALTQHAQGELAAIIHIVRGGVAGLLRAQPDMELVGEAASGVEAVQRAAAAQRSGSNEL